MGMSDKPYCYSKDKELHGLDMNNGHHQPRNQEPSQCIGKTSANPHRNGWTTHSTEPQVRVGANGNNDGPLTDDHQEKDDREESNAASRQDQQDIGCPFELEVGALHMAQEMQEMKEKMDMMISAMRGQVSTSLDELVHRTDSLFTVLVTSFPLLAKFTMPHHTPRFFLWLENIIIPNYNECKLLNFTQKIERMLKG